MSKIHKLTLKQWLIMMKYMNIYYMDIYFIGKKSCCCLLMLVNIQSIKTGNNSTNKHELPHAQCSSWPGHDM